MIKINLSTAKKQVDISNIGGLDFTKLKIKAVLFVIILIYAPDFTLVPMWESEREELNQAFTQKEAENAKLLEQIQKTNDYDKQIKELKAQEETLGQKLMAVKQAISEKRNPSSLLLYIAKNVPKDLWVKELSIEGNSMLIKGEALDYGSIGSFVNSLRSSVFIKDANIGNTTSNVRESDKRRIESFEVTFIIGRFDQ